MFRWCGCLAAAILWPSMASAQLFTEQEQAWIREHPVVRYAIDPYWPMEYRDNKGRHQGLTREYIDYVQETTGLVFQEVPSPNLQHSLDMIGRGELDLLPAVSTHLLDDEFGHRLLYSDPYFVGASVIITKAASPIAYSPAKLEGQLVAVKRGGNYERYLSRHYSGIHLLLLDEAEDALAAVDEGTADAVVGLDQALRPLVRRKYFDQLHLSGVISEMPAVIAMGISPREPVLKAIIDKSLATLTSRATDQMQARWIAQTDFGAPSWSTLLRYYRGELLGLALCVLLLVLFARNATRARREAQRSEEAKSAFLAMMTHEIRTPMNAILSSIELLRRTPLQARQEQLASLAASAAGNLLELLDDVLSLSRLQARQVQLDPQPTELWALAEAVADIHRLGANQKGVALAFVHEGPAPALVRIDPVRTRQILNNLLSNAVKFTHQGRIELRMRLTLGAMPCLHVEVADTGIGIDPQRQAQVFQPFVQAENSTSRRYGGSGLGLAICKDLVALMEGDIGLRSQAGEGTTVWFRVPVQWLGDEKEPGNSVEVPADDVATVSSQTERKILLVEDHVVNQQAISLQLEALGYGCELVADGPAALARLEHQPLFDAILMDCHLPGMDGYEVTRRIRELERRAGRRRTPVLAISAATDDAHRERVFASEMDGSLSKPLRLAELESLLDLWISEPASDLPGVPSVDSRLVQVFIDSTEADLLGLAAALEAGDAAQAAHQAHRIHGAALMVGANEVASLAAALEASLAEPGGGSSGPQPLDALRAALRRYRKVRPAEQVSASERL